MKRGVAALKKLARFALVEVGGGKRKAVRLKAQRRAGNLTSNKQFTINN